MSTTTRHAVSAGEEISLEDRRDRLDVALRPSVFFEGTRYGLADTGTVIGSAADAGVRIDSPRAAGRHAVITRGSDGAAWIEDASGIGLLVNGEVLTGKTRRLRGGDRISIGGRHMFFTDGTEGLLPTVGTRATDHDRLVIGSAEDCDVILDHPSVSPVHAVLEHRGGGAFLRDHSAARTLLVNGQPPSPGGLEPGSELAIGPYRLVFDGRTMIKRRVAGLRLDVCGVAKRIGRRTILHPTTFSVAPGELVAIIGASGTGKSTLLRMLAATDVPDSGVVALGGEPIVARRQDVGYVPQDEIVHRELSVGEALQFAAALRMPADADESRVADAARSIAQDLGLAEHGETLVGNLSGGQRKRVGVATELVNEPAILLLDEPTTGLDAGLERKAMRLFRHLAGGQRSVVLVTHSTRNLDLCDRVLILGPGGRACFFGRPDEARRFFDVAELAEVYDALEATPSETWAMAFEADPRRRREHAETELAASAVSGPAIPRRRRRLGLIREFATLTARYARVFTRDRKNLFLLLAQAPILGLLAALIFPSGAFDSVDRARDATNLIFLLTTIAVWLGAISASREVVRERALLLRETAIGVRTSAYLASKLVVLGGLVSLQVTAMALCAFALQPPDVGLAAVGGMLACLLIAGWVAVTLGLMISACATTENQATSLIPLTLIPQLLLGGAIVTVASMSVAMQGVASLVFTRWFFAGTGSAYDLSERIAEDPVFGAVNTYGSSFFSLPLTNVLAIGAAFAGTMLLITALLIHRRGRPSSSPGSRS
jgi:ABC-type multidrug transport system ATPase subunit/pSer/pThr/pTyr-binding forkhead associated (FHA) protein